MEERGDRRGEERGEKREERIREQEKDWCADWKKKSAVRFCFPVRGQGGGSSGPPHGVFCEGSQCGSVALVPFCRCIGFCLLGGLWPSTFLFSTLSFCEGWKRDRASIHLSAQGWQVDVFRQAFGLSSFLEGLNVVWLVPIYHCKCNTFMSFKGTFGLVTCHCSSSHYLVQKALIWVGLVCACRCRGGMLVSWRRAFGLVPFPLLFCTLFFFWEGSECGRPKKIAAPIYLSLQGW